MTGGILIVGASQAGVQLAVSLREAGYGGPVTLVGAERHEPYSRPPLSKAFLAGKADLASLSLRAPDFYRGQGISVLLGERVVALELDDTAGTATTSTGRRLDFDRLALAVGARPRRLAVPGAELDGVCYLRRLDHSVRLRERLAEAHRVVVVGGGFIGLEAAAVARSAGRQVTVVEAADRLVSRSVAPVMSEFYRRAHERRGTAIRLGVSVSAIEPVHANGSAGRVGAVRLGDGTRVPADAVVVGVGIEPRLELAAQLGLHCDRGIVVDALSRTSRAGVVAAGDCTVSPNPLTGEGRFRLESVQNAVAQAKVAASTLLGRLEFTPTVPWFWSDQYDLKLQIAGLSQGYDECVVRGTPDGEAFTVFYYRGGRLLAADAVNRPRDYLVVRQALGRGLTVPPEAAADPQRDLRSSISQSQQVG